MKTTGITEQAKIDQAKADIIAYQTLPPQIDYVAPYRQVANTAEEFLESLPEEISKPVFEEIEKTVEQYYESGAADHDAMF
jgi:hypothetical protein